MLSISDTTHVNYEKPPKAQFYPDLSMDYFDDQNAAEYKPISDDLKGGSKQGSNLSNDKAETQPQAAVLPQSSENTTNYLQEIADASDEAAKLIESNKPTYDQDRERRLKRLGRAQKFTDAFTVLAQAIGAKAGAIVPQVQLNNANETSEAIRRMRELHENEKQRYDLINFQERLRQVNLKQQEAQRKYEIQNQNTEYDRRFEIESKRRSEELTAQEQKELNILKQRNAYENDPNSEENKRKKRELEMNASLNTARINEYNASVSSKNAFAEREKIISERIKAGLTARPTSNSSAYLNLYESPTSKTPALVIQDEGQALAYYYAIMQNTSLKSDDVESARLDYELGTPPDKKTIVDIVSKHWQSITPIKKDSTTLKQEAPAYFQSEENLKKLEARFNAIDLSYPQDSVMRDRMKVTDLVKTTNMTEQEAIELVNKLR